MYEVTVSGTFSAAHSLRNYRGRCENLHGHNWKVEVTLSGKRLDPAGMLYDFTRLKEILGEILSGLDHKNLNDLSIFKKKNPTSENIACYILNMVRSITSRQRGIKVECVKVWESEGSHAVCR